MDGNATPVNMTVHLNSHAHMVISFDSTWTFTIFSLTFFELLDNSQEVMVLLSTIDNQSQSILQLQPLLSLLQKICAVEDFSNPNKTFLCPFSTPKTSQDLVVLGLEASNVSKMVRNLKVIPNLVYRVTEMKASLLLLGYI